MMSFRFPKTTLLAAMLAVTAIGQAKLPQYSRDTLPNGTVVLLMPRSGVPLVHFRVLIKGGAEAEPPETAGLASVTATLLRKGTAKRTADQFATELDFLGGSLAANSDTSATSVIAEFLSKDFDRGLDLLSDAILNPTFPKEEAAKELARRADAARASKDNPQAAIGSYLRAAFYGPEHPYGHSADELTLARIQQKDILEFYRRVYCGRNTIVTVTGDFDPATAKSKLAASFGRAAAGTAYTWAAPAAPSRKAQLLLVDKPDATQTYFQIAQPGIDRKSADRITLDLINTLFGGRFTSVLNDELRVNSGLTYGASSSVERARLPGAITISTYTKTETTAPAVDLALDVLKRFNQNGISAEQLASAKAYVKGNFPTARLETMDQLATVISELELYDQTRDEIDSYFERIDAVTLETANAAIKKYYQTPNLTLVLLGAAQNIQGVEKYGPGLRVVSIKTPGWR